MKKLIAVLISFTSYLSSVNHVFAQAVRLRGNECIHPSGGLGGVVTLRCIFPLLANAIFWLITIAGTVALFLVIFGGIKFLTSSGDPNKVDSAKKTITWAIIGLVIVLLSFMIANIVAQIAGINCSFKFGPVNQIDFTWCSY